MSTSNVISAIISQNDRIFADDTTVNPTITGAPTVAEISTFAGTNTNVVIYYTGNDTPTDPSTYVFDVDNSGSVTLLEEPSVIDDQGASGYIDIGTVRMQWGQSTATGAVVSFPAAFADTTYALTTNPTSQASAGDRIISTGSETTTGFNLYSFNSGSNTASNAGEPVSWIAIGLKP